MPFSLQTITALTEALTGGSAGERAARIGIYRSGPKLERFLGALNILLRIDGSSRVPAVCDVLLEENQKPDGAATIIRVIEACVDPRDYLDDPSKLEAVVAYLNKHLEIDDYEIRRVGQRHRVVARATNTVAADALKQKARVLDLSSVHADFERALAQADSDPPGGTEGSPRRALPSRASASASSTK